MTVGLPCGPLLTRKVPQPVSLDLHSSGAQSKPVRFLNANKGPSPLDISVSAVSMAAIFDLFHSTHKLSTKFLWHTKKYIILFANLTRK